MRRDGAHRACCFRDGARGCGRHEEWHSAWGVAIDDTTTRGAVTTERRVVAAARAWREGSQRKRKVGRRKTAARRAPDNVCSWRRSCHGSRQGSAGGGGGVGSGGLSTVVRGADRAAVRGAHEGRGEVVVAAAKVISVAATMASAETK